jgi:hypothetical protein
MSRGPSPPPTGRLPAAEEDTRMDEQDNTVTQHSATERQLRHLVVPAPGAYEPSRRIEVVHNPDLDLLWGPNE